MLIVAGRAGAFDEDHLRQVLIGIGTGENVVVLLDVAYIPLNLGIVPVGPIREEDAVVLVIVFPGDAGVGQGAKDGGPLPGGIAGISWRIAVSIRSCCEQIHPVGHGVGRNRGIPGVVGSKLCCQLIVIRQVGLIVVT